MVSLRAALDLSYPRPTDLETETISDLGRYRDFEFGAIMPQPGFRFRTDVSTEGTVTLKLPLPPGTPVEVVVLAPEVEEFDDLVQAASTTTDFWDNPWDDEDWNHAAAR